MRRQVWTDEAPQAIGPYSQAIVSGDLVFCSGQIALDPATGVLVEGGIAEQTLRAFGNLRAVLEAAGATLQDVVKTTVFLASMDDFPAMNEVYERFFTGEPPARSTVAVKTLPKNALFEIEAIARIPGGRRLEMDDDKHMAQEERPRDTLENDLGAEDESGFGWRKLLAISLLFVVLGLLALSLLSFEVFFLIPAAVVAVALILARVKGRLSGVAGLVGIAAVVFLNFWIVFSLFTPGSVFEFSSALIVALGVLFGLISAIGALVKPRSGSRSARTLAFTMIILLVAGLGYSVYSYSLIDSAVTEEGDLEVTMADFEFDPQELEAEEGRIGVSVANNDNFTHTFTIDELDVDLSVEAGVSRRTAFFAESGSYKWYCAPHPEMTGTLTVE